MPRLLKLTLFFAAALSLFGCNKAPDLSSLPKISLSPELHTIYQQSCANCHTNANTGAPLTGNTEQWQIVLDKPMEHTLQRVTDGYQGMPPLGQCFECSLEQFEQLIHYMSRPAL